MPARFELFCPFNPKPEAVLSKGVKKLYWKLNQGSCKCCFLNETSTFRTKPAANDSTVSKSLDGFDSNKTAGLSNHKLASKQSQQGQGGSIMRNDVINGGGRGGGGVASSKSKRPLAPPMRNSRSLSPIKPTSGRFDAALSRYRMFPCLTIGEIVPKRS